MKDSKYVLLNNTKIIIISDLLEVCLSLYIDKIIENKNINMKQCVVQEYLEGVTLLRNIYFDITNKRFIDEYDQIINIPIDLNNKINKYITSYDLAETQTQLDIFIPLSISVPNKDVKTDNVINTEFINRFEKENKEIDIDFIKKRIDELTQIKNKETERLEDIKNEISLKKETILKKKSEAETKKSKLKYEKDKWNELKRKYDINYNIYITLKNEIRTGDRNENDIPELFVNEYKIFEKIFIPDVDKKELFNSYLDEKKQNKDVDLFTKYNNLFEDDNIVISDNSTESPETSEDYDSNDD
jgi:hypothetical protein